MVVFARRHWLAGWCRSGKWRRRHNPHQQIQNARSFLLRKQTVVASRITEKDAVRVMPGRGLTSFSKAGGPPGEVSRNSLASWRRAFAATPPAVATDLLHLVGFCSPGAVLMVTLPRRGVCHFGRSRAASSARSSSVKPKTAICRRKSRRAAGWSAAVMGSGSVRRGPGLGGGVVASSLALMASTQRS
jgi:hypothetical protein